MVGIGWCVVQNRKRFLSYYSASRLSIAGKIGWQGHLARVFSKHWRDGHRPKVGRATQVLHLSGKCSSDSFAQQNVRE